MPYSFAYQPRPAIRSLPTHLANQIAAGEVVERPASIVKELLENSIDAGAKHITLVLEKGGLQSINVLDDGWGIPVEELTLALAPHATSKIYQVEDLSAITSMGFRGEALASIASVARLTLTSRTAENETGWQLTGRQAETHVQAKPAAHPVGTSVQVDELFFNTPARRRFLRSERTEYRHCEDVVRRLALSNFAISFKLIHNGKTIFNFPATEDEAGIRFRLQKFGGKRFANEALTLSYEASDLRMHGWLGTPDLARPQSDLQFFFVNGRIIRDRLVSHALRQAYGNSIFPGRHPAYVLFLEMQHEDIDVNVHPTKHEVRFHQARLVHDFLNSGARHVLQNAVPESSSPQIQNKSSKLAWHKSAPPNVHDLNQYHRGTLRENTSNTKTHAVAENIPHYHVGNIADDQFNPVEIPLLFERYGLFSHGSEWGIIDMTLYWQHELEQTFNDKTRSVDVKPLLFPQTIVLTGEQLAGEQLAKIKSLLPLLNELGIDCSLVRPDTSDQQHLILRQLPSVLEYIAINKFIIDLLNNVAKENITQAELIEMFTNLAASYLNKSTHVKFNHVLENIMQQLTGNLIWQHPAIKRLTMDILQQLFQPS